MSVYRLRATMQFTDGRDGLATDINDIEAADLASAIALSLDWRPGTPHLVPDALLLISPEGAVVWSLRRVADP